MTDITMWILADHAWFREQFARLDNLQARAPRKSDPLEKGLASPCRQARCACVPRRENFLSTTLAGGVDDPEGETLDAIGDHNDIRAGVRDADAAAIDTDEWWAAVGRTREANDEHMGEEEREGLSDFRRHAPIGLREAPGHQYSEFTAQHPTTAGLRIVDRDPLTMSRLPAPNPQRGTPTDHSVSAV